MKIIYESDMGLTKAKFREIGRIIAYWSLLEMLMGLAIGNMLGLARKEGRRRTLEKSVYKLTEMLVDASRKCKLSKPETDRMNLLIARIKKEHPRRNDVAHGIWGLDNKKWSLLRFKKPHLVDFGKGEPMTARDLQKIANRAATLTRDFQRWLKTIPTP